MRKSEAGAAVPVDHLGVGDWGVRTHWRVVQKMDRRFKNTAHPPKVTDSCVTDIRETFV
jgi:hypothetical protein